MNTKDIKTDVFVVEAIERLIDIARGDSGGSRRAAKFLLSLWDGDRFKVDLQELLYVDQEQFEDMQAVMKGLFDLNAQLYTFVSQETMSPILEIWGPQEHQSE